MSRKSSMNVGGKSDGRVVPAKHPRILDSASKILNARTFYPELPEGHAPRSIMPPLLKTDGMSKVWPTVSTNIKKAQQIQQQ